MGVSAFPLFSARSFRTRREVLYNTTRTKDKGEIRYRVLGDERGGCATRRLTATSLATRFRCTVSGLYISRLPSRSCPQAPPFLPSLLLSYVVPILLSSFVVRNDKGILFDERIPSYFSRASSLL